MNDIVGNVAQELADYLDDLRDTGVGVTNYDAEDADDLGGDVGHKITEVGDAELNPGTNTVSFFAVVGGKRMWVTVGEVLAPLADQVTDRPNLWEDK